MLTAHRFGACVLIVVLDGLLLSCQVANRPARPANVPADAVREPGGKTQWWIRCEYRRNDNVCQVYNAGGIVLRNEIYRPYDGGGPVRPEDLKIDPHHSIGVPYVVYLKNGRVLLPSSDFDRQKQFLDEFLDSVRRRR